MSIVDGVSGLLVLLFLAERLINCNRGSLPGGIDSSLLLNTKSLCVSSVKSVKPELPLKSVKLPTDVAPGLNGVGLALLDLNNSNRGSLNLLDDSNSSSSFIGTNPVIVISSKLSFVSLKSGLLLGGADLLICSYFTKLTKIC